MSETGRPKKHRHKRHYTFMIVSGDSDGSSGSFHLGHVATQVLAFSIFAIIVALICVLINTAITLSSLKEQNLKLAAELSEYEEINSQLTASNTELESEVTQLSQALNQKVETEEQTAAEEEELSLPTLLPISNGTASMTSTYDDPDSTEPVTAAPEADSEAAENTENTEDTTDTDENADETAEDTENADGAETTEATDENTDDTESTDGTDTTEDAEATGDPILILTAEEGSTVIASGSGTVTSVTADIKYGNVITIDHGNGYTSIYRNSGDSLVHEGDEITRGTTLIVVGEENTILGYQIKSGDEFINPEDMIEING